MTGKLEKYRQIENFPNVIDGGFVRDNPLEIAGYWSDDRFAVKQDLTVELGCGRGEYTVNHAENYPDRNFIGIDIKGSRLWHGATYALNKNLQNAVFVRMNIDHLSLFFPQNSISEIWITFPEPHERQSGKNADRRLTSKKFLDIYRRILKPEGTMNLKTDSDFLYNFTLETAEELHCSTLRATDDLYSSPEYGDPVNIQTTFEKKYLSESKTIKYIKLSFDNK